MEAFNNVLGDCRLSDLDFRGPKFTWNNWCTDHGFTKKRLGNARRLRRGCKTNPKGKISHGEQMGDCTRKAKKMSTNTSEMGKKICQFDDGAYQTEDKGASRSPTGGGAHR